MYEESSQQEWLHAYALLALRMNRVVNESSGQNILIFLGPDAWREAVAGERLVPAEQLAADLFAGRDRAIL